jgi:hypothetical protein
MENYFDNNALIDGLAPNANTIEKITKQRDWLIAGAVVLIIGVGMLYWEYRRSVIRKRSFINFE